MAGKRSFAQTPSIHCLILRLVNIDSGSAGFCQLRARRCIRCCHKRATPFPSLAAVASRKGSTRAMANSMKAIGSSMMRASSGNEHHGNYDRHDVFASGVRRNGVLSAHRPVLPSFYILLHAHPLTRTRQARGARTIMLHPSSFLSRFRATYIRAIGSSPYESPSRLSMRFYDGRFYRVLHGFEDATRSLSICSCAGSG
jgi:hypothetical protein